MAAAPTAAAAAATTPCDDREAAGSSTHDIPPHCPTPHDVDIHPPPVPTATALPRLRGSAVGRQLAVPWSSPAAATLRTALTHKPKGLPPQQRRRVRPTRFYTRQHGHLLTSAMAWLCAGFHPDADGRDRGVHLPHGTRYTNPRGLFPFQAKVVDAVHRRLATLDGGMVIAPCGMGKSEIMAAIIAAEGVRTLLMVPRTDIATQLANLLRRRFPGLVIAILDGNHPASKLPPDVHILIAVVNSAANPKHRPLFKGVGLVLVDEAHHAPAVVMQLALANCAGRKVVGLTATPYRADGFEVVLPFLFGPAIAEVHRPWMPVVVRNIILRHAFPAAHDAETFQAAVSALAECPAWNGAIEDGVLACARRLKPLGGRVLVLVASLRLTMELCDRVGGAVTKPQWDRLRRYETRKVKDAATGETTKEWAPACRPAFRDTAPDTAWSNITSSLYVGTTQTPRERRLAGDTADVVWCTESKAYEGLDLQNIHCVWLACKPTRPQQHVGRGLRITSMANVPEMVFLTEPAVSKLHNAQRCQRRYFSVQEGWPIIAVESTNVARVFATAGTPPTTPTPAYLRHKHQTRPQANHPTLTGHKRKRNLAVQSQHGTASSNNNT